ncbi:MAG: InlB B-repeat-containing protein [Aeriscardovia sp.]|nr:InlB B-repeat-containing protein [Aeriscardovia sp.]
MTPTLRRLTALAATLTTMTSGLTIAECAFANTLTHENISIMKHDLSETLLTSTHSTQNNTLIPLHTVGTATITSVTTTSGQPISTPSHHASGGAVHITQNGIINITITFTPNQEFTAGQTILLHLSNGTHQPCYATALHGAHYMISHDGTALFHVTTQPTGNISTDTQGTNILLTALPSINGRKNISGTLQVNCNWFNAKIRSDLLHGNTATISIDNHPYTVMVQPPALTPLTGNSGYMYHGTQAWSGHAASIIGWNWNALQNSLLTHHLSPDDSRLSTSLIAWQHITAPTPFTVTAFNNGFVNWASPTLTTISNTLDYLSYTPTISTLTTDNISSWKQAATLLTGHVGTTLISSDRHGGYYVASNLGSPRHMPTTTADTMQPLATNNTGMSHLETELKTMGTDYPSAWQQVIYEHFTNHPMNTQTATIQYAIGPASGTGIAPYTEGTFTTTSASTADTAEGELFVPLIYNPNGGTGSMPHTIIKADGSTPLEPNKFTHHGYKWTGWGNSPSCSTPQAAGTIEHMGTTSKTVYACWTRLPGTVTWTKTADHSTTPLAGSVWTLTNTTTGQTLTISHTQNNTNPTHGEFTVTHLTWGTWTLREKTAPHDYNLNPHVWTFTINAQHTTIHLGDLHDKKTPAIVEYLPNGGTGHMNPQHTTYESSPTTEPNKYKNHGKHFLGWNTQPHGQGTWYQPGNPQDPITQPLRKLYAQWAGTQDATVTLNVRKKVTGTATTNHFDFHLIPATTTTTMAIRNGDIVSSYFATVTTHHDTQSSLHITQIGTIAGTHMIQTSWVSNGAIHCVGELPSTIVWSTVNDLPQTVTLSDGHQVPLTWSTPEPVANSTLRRIVSRVRILINQQPVWLTLSGWWNGNTTDHSTSPDGWTNLIHPTDTWTAETTGNFTNGETKTVTWHPLEFTQPGTYHFILEEVGTPTSGWTYNETPHTVTVTVTQEPDGQLTAHTTGNDPLIINTWTATQHQGHHIGTPVAAAPLTTSSANTTEPLDDRLATTGATITGIATLGMATLGSGITLLNRKYHFLHRPRH